MYVDNPKDNERIVVTKERRVKEHLPPYNLVGNGLTNRHGTSLDIIDVCVQMNLSELRLLQFLRNEFNYACIRGENTPNEIVPTSSDEWSDYLKIALKKNYIHLRHLRILVRISRGKYLLNPYLFMYTKEYGEVQGRWNQLLDDLGDEL